MAVSAPQTVPLIEVYDYELAAGDPSVSATSAGLAGKKVKVTLAYDKARTISPDPVVWVEQEAVYTAVTDGNGFWRVFLVPNNKITPANTYYIVQIEGYKTYRIQVTDVGVPGVGWQSSAAGILLDIPAALAPTTSTVGAITATGLITAQAGIAITGGGLTIVGGETDVGGLTVDSITYSTAVSRLIAGSTSFSVRDSTNAFDNLIVTNAGNATVRGSLTVTAGPLTVSAGGAAITGNSTVTGTFTSSGALTVQAGGAAITGNSTVTGTLTVSALLTAQAGVTLSGGNLTISTGNLTITAGSETITAGDLTITAGKLNFGAAASRIVPGATSLSLRNTANTADNLIILDAGPATFRGSVTTGDQLIVPPSAGGTPAASSYGTVPVKIAEFLLAATSADIIFSSLTTGFRHLKFEWYARGDTAATTTAINMRLNNVSTATYDSIFVDNSSATAAAAVEQLATTAMQIGAINAANATANYFSPGEAQIKHYQGAVGNKLVLTHSGQSDSDVTTHIQVFIGMGKWRTTATPVTRVDLLPGAGNFIIGSLFTAWGEP